MKDLVLTQRHEYLFLGLQVTTEELYPSIGSKIEAALRQFQPLVRPSFGIRRLFAQPLQFNLKGSLLALEEILVLHFSQVAAPHQRVQLGSSLQGLFLLGLLNGAPVAYFDVMTLHKGLYRPLLEFRKYRVDVHVFFDLPLQVQYRHAFR